MIVCGATVSSPENACTSGVGSMFPARSIARTSNVNMLSSAGGTTYGFEHVTHWSSGGIGSHGAMISTCSVGSCSTSRHSYWSSSTGVLSSRAGEPERDGLERVRDGAR